MTHRGRENAFYQHGRRAGWREYRYGEEDRKPVSLAPVSMLRKSKPIIRKQQRKQFLSAVMDGLRDWRFSPFENEALMRKAVRIHFVERHHGWMPSDEEAARLVAEALRLMGAERPSWLEGQWIHTAPRENCLWCHGPIDDEDQARGRRFCSEMCAKSSIEKRVRVGRAHDDMVLKQAYSELGHWRARPRSCKHCGRDFRNSAADVQFCSRRCYHASTVELTNIACADCGTPFRPRQKSQRYCSSKCGKSGGMKLVASRVVEDRLCPCCLTMFRPKNDAMKFCSSRCRVTFCKRGIRARTSLPALPSNVIYLTLEIFDGWFKRAA